MRASRPVLRRLLPSLGTVPILLGCATAVPFHPMMAVGSPLGPSCILMPRSIEDDALLGRVLLEAPGNGRSLDEVSRPNDCSDKLAPKKEERIATAFEDAQELAGGGKARAALGTFGLEEDAQAATHFYYKIDLEKRVTQAETPDYLACCKDKGTCGYGFVSALAYGEGQYATAVENSAEGSFDIPVAGEARGFVKAKLLHKRNVYGYVAAFVTVTDGAKSIAVSVLGDPAAVRIEPTEQDVAEGAKARFELQKIQVVAANSGAPGAYAYFLRDGSGTISENEFVRRFEAITGSTELSGAKRNRNPAWLYYGVAASAAGAFFIGVGSYLALATPQSTQTFTTPPSPSSLSRSCNFSTLQFVSGVGYELACSAHVNPGLGKVFGITGGVVMASGLASFATYGILGYDGSKGDHTLSKADADLYVAKYNRELLRKAVQGTKEPAPQITGKSDSPSFMIAPLVSPGFTGIVGTF